MNKRTNIEITKSSGNVYADLGLSKPEECLAKAGLAYQINQLIKRKGLKQGQAAELLKIDQPKISALNRGRLSGFSVERLLRFLAILNQDVEIIIRPHLRSHRSHRAPCLQVRYADV